MYIQLSASSGIGEEYVPIHILHVYRGTCSYK